MKFQVDSYSGDYLNKTSNHLYIAPIEELKHIVAHYTITFVNKEVDIPKNRVLQLIPDVSGCFVFHFFEKLYITVWGPTTEIVVVNNDLNSAPCRFFVEFLPGGLYQTLGLDVHDILNKKIALECINENLFHEINQHVLHMTSFDEIVNLMNTIILREVKRHMIDKKIYKWIEKLNREYHLESVKQIADDIGISERQLTRYFNRYVGMGVKKYSKFVNVNHAIQMLMDKKLLDLAIDYNYFDQAHFNHAFKEICGTNPTNYIENFSDFYNELYKF